jgi:hypothetical protein
MKNNHIDNVFDSLLLLKHIMPNFVYANKWFDGKSGCIVSAYLLSKRLFSKNSLQNIETFERLLSLSSFQAEAFIAGFDNSPKDSFKRKMIPYYELGNLFRMELMNDNN